VALCRTNVKKLPVSLAESALLSTEESIMATFDFLSSENVVDEEAMSDGENDDGLPDDDNNDDRLLVNRAKVKVVYSIDAVLLGYIACAECRDVAYCYRCSMVCVCMCICLLDTAVSPSKTVEPIEMSFRVLTQCYRCGPESQWRKE